MDLANPAPDLSGSACPERTGLRLIPARRASLKSPEAVANASGLRRSRPRKASFRSWWPYRRAYCLCRKNRMRRYRTHSGCVRRSRLCQQKSAGCWRRWLPVVHHYLVEQATKRLPKWHILGASCLRLLKHTRSFDPSVIILKCLKVERRSFTQPSGALILLISLTSDRGRRPCQAVKRERLSKALRFHHLMDDGFAGSFTLLA